MHPLVLVAEDIKLKGSNRGDIRSVPLAIRSHDTLGAGFERRIRRQLANRLSHAPYRISRGSVRFEDVNGPRGGVDTVCRIKLVMPRRPSIIVEKRAASHAVAFASAVTAVGTAIERAQGKSTQGKARAAAARSHTRKARTRRTPTL